MRALVDNHVTFHELHWKMEQEALHSPPLLTYNTGTACSTVGPVFAGGVQSECRFKTKIIHITNSK